MPPKKSGGQPKRVPKEAAPAETEEGGASALSAALDASEASEAAEAAAASPSGQSNGGPASLASLWRPKRIYHSFTFMADEADAFFEAEGNGHRNGDYGPPVLTAEEREALTADLKKTEDEVNTLRQVLQARLKHAGELKRKLGLTPWTEAVHDLSAGLKTVRESPAYQKTAAAAATGAEVVTAKLGALKNSTAFKSFGESVGNAYTNVKKSASQAKIAASTSMQSFAGATTPGAEAPPAAPLS